MEGAQLEKAKKMYPTIWNRINDEWRASAEKSTDGRPDYKWAQEQAEKEFQKTLKAEGLL